MDKLLNEYIELTAKEYYNKQKDYSSFFNLLQKCRIGGYYYIGYFVGKILEKVNDWRFLDELSICAYYIGEYKESYNLCEKILNICPEKDKNRIKTNLIYSKRKMETK